MKAALVTSFGSAPSFSGHPDPAPSGEGEMVVDVLAAGLHPRVRSQADGSHYTSTGALPLVPGIDGVGRGSDGLLRYFVLPDTQLGSMAQRTLIDVRRSIVLPEGADPIAVAAGMNPAMSSWVALRQRVRLDPGQNVLVLGATGSAGRLAVQVAVLLGAARVIAAGRDPDRLAGLRAAGATDVVSLADGAAADRLGGACAEVDVVLDYLWGEPTAAAMVAVVTGRADRSTPLSWVEVGSVAGPTASIPAAALRAARLQIVGSGQGSVGTREIVGELPELARHIIGGSLAVDARPVPLAEVRQAWADAGRTGRRIVLTPSVA